MDAPRDEDANQKPADVSRPLAGVVICCTAIPPERRTELEKQIRQLGGIHTYDLIVDVTHLIVGNYNTIKYRHVAKERHDIKVMDGVWIDALTDLWTRDAPIDLPAVEAQWRLLPLETNGPAPGDEDRGRLACSISGFHDLEERQNIIDRIVENGGIYLADLDRKNVTHLIVNEPKGNKFEAARKWGMHTVSLAWLDQSIERGMILDEDLFDPKLPLEEQGLNAWVKPSERTHRSGAGKRSISAVEPSALSHEQRKLRRTTSMKLGGQRDNIWGDIMANKDSSARTVFADDRIEVVDSAWDLAAKNAPPEAVFISCCFFIAGFDEWQFTIMTRVIRELGGAILDEMDDFSMIQDGSTRRCLLFVVVPQCSRPETHPEMPPPGRLPVRKVTEFFIERCLHAKTLFDPLDHVLGRPFPKWPLDGFQGLTMGTSGFAGIDLLHVEKCVTFMGARYTPRLNESVSILLCQSLDSTRADKIKLAMENDIPIVSADWLWSCIAASTMLPVRDFLFPSLKQKPTVTPRPRALKRPESGGGLESTAQPGGTAVAPGAATRPESRDKRVDAPSVAPAVTATTVPARSAAALEVPAEAPSATSTTKASVAAPAAPTPSAAALAPPPTRKDQFVDRSAFADDGPQGAKTGGKLVPRTSKPEPASFPTRDSFGSGIVQKPARSLSTPIPKQTAPQNPAKKPAEASKPAPAEPIKPTESAEVTTAVKPADPTISEAAPAPEDEPDEAAAILPGPPPNPPAASVQPSIEHHPTNPEDDVEEKHNRRRDEDQRAAERAAMASTIMASKLNSLAGAKAGDGTGDEEGGTKPTRRRKGIFGRAISNVSAASSGSHDSVQQQQQQQQIVGEEGFHRSRSDGVLHDIARVDATEDESALPSTQIGWNDAAGAQAKAEMMQRLLLAELGPDAVLPPIPQPPPQRRLPTTTSTTTTTTRATRRSTRR